MNSEILKESGNFIDKAGSWGEVQITIFFVIVLLIVTGGFVWVLIKKVLGVVEQNTNSNKDLLKAIEISNATATQNIEIQKSFLNEIKNKLDGILAKQNETHNTLKDFIKEWER
ncbi:MAG: hypothetical protein MR902_01735 [Campylobacter sp.]|nr:hypothetical protein [Campylobacter sp.]